MIAHLRMPAIVPGASHDSWFLAADCEGLPECSIKGAYT